MTNERTRRIGRSDQQGSEDQGALGVALVQLPLLIAVVLLAVAVAITPGGSEAVGESGNQPSVQYHLLMFEVDYLYSKKIGHDVTHEVKIERPDTTIVNSFTWSKASSPSQSESLLENAWPGGSTQVTSQVEDLGAANLTWPDEWEKGPNFFGVPRVLRMRYFARLDYLTYRSGARVTFQMDEMSGRSPCPNMKDRESPVPGGTTVIQGNENRGTITFSTSGPKAIKATPRDVATVLQTGLSQRGTNPIRVLGFVSETMHEVQGTTCIVSDNQGIRYARLFYPYGVAAQVRAQSSSSTTSHEKRFTIRAPSKGPMSVSFDLADAPATMLETATRNSALTPIPEVLP